MVHPITMVDRVSFVSFEILLHNNNNNNMLIVQYPMQFRGPPGNISNPCSAPFGAGEWWFN